MPISVTGLYISPGTGYRYSQDAAPLKLTIHHAKFMHQSSGFSLLELLVVVFIIGILATMMTLSIGITGGDRELEQEIERIRALIDLAAEEAVLQGQEIGIRFYENRYEFSTETWYTRESEETTTTVARWRLMTGDDLFKPRDLGENLRIELEIDGRQVILEPFSEREQREERKREEEDTDEDDEDAYKPQVFILSSGDMTPFTVNLRRRFGNTGMILTAEADGSIELLHDDI
jgi:general secretion pathway protein H